MMSLAVWGLVAGAFVIRICLVCVYRLWFHPFAKYPGPFWAKLTNAYSAYQAYKQDTHVTILKLHEQHGPVIRYGPNRLLFNSRESLEDIYGTHRNCFKGAAYDAMRVQPVPSVFNASSDQVHAQRRKIVAQGFSDAAMRACEPVILKHVAEYCDALYGTAPVPGTEWSEARDLTVWSAYLSVDLIADLTLGHSTDMLTSPVNRVFNAARKANFRRMGLAIQWPEVFLNKIFRRSLSMGDFLFPKTAKLQREWHALLGSWIADRVREMRSGDKPSDRRDMISSITAYCDPETGNALNDADLVAELTTLLIAGSGTITTGMTSTLFYLSRNPDACDAVTNEVRRVFNSINEIRMGSQLTSCKRLRACFQEAMRMSPPPTTPLYREAGPGGSIVCGIHIPEGAEVATTIYALHHNEAHFRDSFDFRPERWSEDVNKAGGDIKAAWAPFSYGPRNCVGMSLATNEVLLAVATLLWQGDFRQPSDPAIAAIGTGKLDLGAGRQRSSEFQMYDTFGASTDGPYLQFRRRAKPATQL